MRTELQGLAATGLGTPTATAPPTCSKRPARPATSPLEEVDERLDIALAACTCGELDRLVADLPREWMARQEPGRPPATPATRRRPALPPEAAWLVPLLVVVAGLLTSPS